MKPIQRFHNGKSGSAISVRVSPKSTKNEISGIMADGTVKIRLTAPPVEGKANKALIKFLSTVLDVAPTNIEIISGQTARDKLVTIIDLDAVTLQKRLLAYISS